MKDEENLQPGLIKNETASVHLWDSKTKVSPSSSLLKGMSVAGKEPGASCLTQASAPYIPGQPSGQLWLGQGWVWSVLRPQWPQQCGRAALQACRTQSWALRPFSRSQSTLQTARRQRELSQDRDTGESFHHSNFCRATGTGQLS